MKALSVLTAGLLALSASAFAENKTSVVHDEAGLQATQTGPYMD